MTETAAVSWAAAGLDGAKLGDARLNRRLVRVAERLGAQPGASIPAAGGGWAETQAAYRLLAHEAVTWEPVLAPHWDCSVERMRRHPVVLGVPDSTELDYTAQPGIAGLGPLSYLRQHGLYASTRPWRSRRTGCRWGCWTPGCGPATGRRSARINGTGRSRPRKAGAGWKASSAAPSWPRACLPPGWSTSPTGNAIFTSSWSGRNGSPGVRDVCNGQLSEGARMIYWRESRGKNE